MIVRDEVRGRSVEGSLDRYTLMSWGIVALVGLAIRLLYIDRAPLSESEATYALQAWLASQGRLDGTLVATGAPLFEHVTTAIFWALATSDIAARLFSALAGVGLALTPALVSELIGRRVALCAGLLIAISPIAIQISRMADPAIGTAAITMVVIAALIRVATDRPWWSRWVLAGGAGLALADEPTIVVALASAALAAAATWGWSPRAWIRSLDKFREPEPWREIAGPLIFGVGVALVASTGAAMDLSGFGFILGDLWGGVTRVLTPAPFPTRNLATLLAYGWPLFALATAACIKRVKSGDKLALFLGQWTLLLAALAAVVGQSSLVLAILPVAPAAILAGIAVVELTPRAFGSRLTGMVWGSAFLPVVVMGALVLGFSQSFGAGRIPSFPGSVPAIAWLLIFIVLAAYIWVRRLGREDRGLAGALFFVLVFSAVSIGGIGRLSFGGSPLGSEPIPREPTDPALPAVFRDMTVLAYADSSRTLAVDDRTPAVVRWYGRDIPATPRPPSTTARPISVRDAPAPGPANAPIIGLRTPLKMTSVLNRSEFNLLGVIRWAVGRGFLIQGRPSDIIISR